MGLLRLHREAEHRRERGGGQLTSGAPELIAKSGDDALIGDGAKFKSFKAVSVADDFFAIGFLAQLAPGTGTPKVTAATDIGLWLKSNALNPRLVLREGQVLQGRTIKTLTAFAAGAGSPGQGRGWLFENPSSGPHMLARVNFTGTDKAQAVVVADLNGALVTLTTPTIPTVPLPEPDIPGATFASFGLPAINRSTLAFLASLTVGDGGVTKADARCLFAGFGVADFTKIARVTEPAGATGATFSVLKDPVLASDNGLAFPATIKGGTVRGAAMQTLWWQPAGQPLALLAQGGTDAVELPGSKWKAFPSLAIATERGPIFTATLTPGRGQSGVWAKDFAGATRLLFRTGAQIGGKTVRSFKLLNATVGSTGVTRSFNDNAQVVWLATFTDKTTAIVVTEVP